MRIYIDFDDVLCETARALTTLCARLFNRPPVPYEAIRFFDLRRAFDLSETDYRRLMDAAHDDAELLAYAPTPGAAETLAAWHAAGHATSIVTGRPPHARAASEAWLRANNFPPLPVLCVDKYNRHGSFAKDAEPPLSLDAFKAMHFDLAVEDAPMGVDLLRQHHDCRIIIFARPWNAGYDTSDPLVTRLPDWPSIAAAVAKGKA